LNPNPAKMASWLIQVLDDGKSMFQRIHIIGGPGSGKSYAARHLSHRLGTPAYDLDELFWDRPAQSYSVQASELSRDGRLAAIAQEPTWIIEGVY
jgi:adenylate kinase family enzyme